jgi:CHAT domain-containing protein
MRAPLHLLGIVLACSVGDAARFQSSVASQPATVLTDHAIVERDAKPDDVHTYEVSLNQGDFFDLDATQDRLLLRLAISTPDGHDLRRINLPQAHPMAERVMIVAPTSGVYRVEVSIEPERGQIVRCSDTSPCGYSLHVLAHRTATADDRTRDQLFDVLEEAEQIVYAARSTDALRPAIAKLQQAADGWHRLGDLRLEATTLKALSNVTGFFTPLRRESATAYERLIPLLRALGESALELDAWQRLAIEYDDDGRLELQQRALLAMLPLAQSLQNRAAEGRALYGLALNQFEWGHYEEARTLSVRAMDQATATRDTRLEARMLWVLGQLDEVAGDFDAAFDHYERGLAVTSDVDTVGLLRIRRGFGHLRRGNLEAARADFEARLAQGRTTSVQSDRDAHARIGLGDTFLAQGRRDEARTTYGEAFTRLGTGAPAIRCIAGQRVARLALDDGRIDEARARFEEIVALATRIGYAHCEAEGRSGLAEVALRDGNLEAADVEARRVLELAESFREATLSLEARALGFGAFAPMYERAIEIAVRQADRGDAGAARRAFEINERALARSLLDRVGEAAPGAIRDGTPAELVQERRRVRDQWRGTLAELHAVSSAATSSKDTEALATQASAAAARLRELDTRIAIADPRRAGFSPSQPLRAEAIQALLNDETVVLEYALGETRSVAWVVSARDVRMVSLPPRTDIESLARRVHRALGARPEVGTRPSAAEADSHALARMILAPLGPLSAKRLVIVPQGALALVPFAALPDPSSLEGLIRQHEIVQVPSATILAALRTLAGRAPGTGRTAVIFADPIFETDDPRVPFNVSRRERGGAIDPSAGSIGSPPHHLALARLPFSRREADAIAAVLPGKVDVLIGVHATRDRALGDTLADARFIHFATHGVVNQRVQNLSSVVLSQVDAHGGPRDGLVMLPDVYDMTLTADLVVLSGCQTALGPDVSGEGTLGLARAFMYAGAHRVVASLWQVNDLATAELMKRFYRRMIVDKLAPAAALRAAQLELATVPRWASPYYWAPFVIQGDWQ